jgi:hypothetical protein
VIRCASHSTARSSHYTLPLSQPRDPISYRQTVVAYGTALPFRMTIVRSAMAFRPASHRCPTRPLRNPPCHPYRAHSTRYRTSPHLHRPTFFVATCAFPGSLVARYTITSGVEVRGPVATGGRLSVQENRQTGTSQGSRNMNEDGSETMLSTSSDLSRQGPQSRRGTSPRLQLWLQNADLDVIFTTSNNERIMNSLPSVSRPYGILLCQYKVFP